MNPSLQSTEKSRERLLAPSSAFIDALDLAASQDKICRYSNILNMPSAHPWKDLSLLYQCIIRNMTRVVDIDMMVKKYKSVELINVQNYENKQIKELVFRVWFKDEKEISSRVLLLAFSKKESKTGHLQEKEVLLFQNIFGNVDLAICPPPPASSDFKESYRFKKIKKSDISKIHPLLFNRIARYLDNGQMLNLGTLHHLNVPELGYPELGCFSKDPYQQYLCDFARYNNLSPNGVLMKPNPSNIRFLLHQTSHKKSILNSKKMNVSKAGCLGNSVYVTTLVKSGGDYIIGGHTTGLLKRKKIVALKNQREKVKICMGEKPDENECFLIEIRSKKNCLTNWIDKTGRGRLFLEARNQLMDSCESLTLLHDITSAGKIKSLMKRLVDGSLRQNDKKYVQEKRQALRLISENVVTQYQYIYPLLTYLMTYRLFTKKTIFCNKEKAIKEFKTVYRIIEEINIRNRKDGNTSCFLNGVYFEIIKDFLLLSQNDSYSQKWRAVGSFNMQLQYQVFFELCPALLVNWDTSQFSLGTNMEDWDLKQQKYLTSTRYREIFEQFFLDRLSYYINICCLEGAERLPDPCEIKSFDHLASQLPALAGTLHHHAIEQLYDKHKIFDEYLEKTRACYDSSYKHRDITMPIKCGFSATEEIGLTSRADVRFYDLKILDRNENGFFEVKKKKPLKVTISGVSQNNGFTNRSPTVGAQ